MTLEYQDQFPKGRQVARGPRPKNSICGNSLDLVHPEDRESVRRIIEEAFQSGQDSSIEYQIIRPDGETRWISARGRRRSEEFGVQDQLMGVSIDITERKQMEQELQVSHNRLARIVSSAMDAIIAIDDDQRVVIFNAAAEKMFGCPVVDAIGSSITRFIPQRFCAEHREHIRRFDETGVTNRSMGTLGALWAMRANGEEFPIEASISQVHAAAKKLFTVIIRDITEREQAMILGMKPPPLSPRCDACNIPKPRKKGEMSS